MRMETIEKRIKLMKFRMKYENNVNGKERLNPLNLTYLKQWASISYLDDRTHIAVISWSG